MRITGDFAFLTLFNELFLKQKTVSNKIAIKEIN